MPGAPNLMSTADVAWHMAHVYGLWHVLVAYDLLVLRYRRHSEPLGRCPMAHVAWPRGNGSWAMAYGPWIMGSGRRQVAAGGGPRFSGGFVIVDQADEPQRGAAAIIWNSRRHGGSHETWTVEHRPCDICHVGCRINRMN